MSQSLTKFFSLKGWWAWVKAKFTFSVNEIKELVVQVVNQADQFMPIAMKTVALIEDSIKIVLKEGGLTQAEIQSSIQGFLEFHGIQSSIANRLAERFAIMPVADALLNIASILIQKDAEKITHVSVSLARTLAQLAYEAYVLSKSRGEQ